MLAFVDQPIAERGNDIAPCASLWNRQREAERARETLARIEEEDEHDDLLLDEDRHADGEGPRDAAE